MWWKFQQAFPKIRESEESDKTSEISEIRQFRRWRAACPCKWELLVQGRPIPLCDFGQLLWFVSRAPKVTDVLRGHWDKNKNKKKQTKKNPSRTSQCNAGTKNFLQLYCWWGHRGHLLKGGGIPQQNSCLELRNPEKNAGGSQLIFGTFFTYFYQTEFIKKARKIENSWKMVGRFVKLDEFWDTRWESFVLPNASLLRCASQHPGI